MWQLDSAPAFKGSHKIDTARATQRQCGNGLFVPAGDKARS